MLKIYGADLSSPANKVRFTANYIGLDFEYVQVKIREGEHRKPEFLAINPVGKIPVIDDDGFKLFESNAICKYLSCKHKSDLYPPDFKEQAVVDQWIDFVTMHVQAAYGRVLFNRVFAPFAKVAVDENSLADGLKFLNRFLPVVNERLGQFDNLAGDKFSLADIVLVATLDPTEVAQVDIAPYENIVKWRNNQKQQAYYTKTYKEYGEPLKKMQAQQQQ